MALDCRRRLRRTEADPEPTSDRGIPVLRLARGRVVSAPGAPPPRGRARQPGPRGRRAPAPSSPRRRARRPGTRRSAGPSRGSRARPRAARRPAGRRRPGASRIAATSVGCGTRTGRRAATATTGVTVKLLTGIHCIDSVPSDPHARRHGVEADLLGRLAEGGRHEVRVPRLGPAARERDLARVVPAAVRPLGEHEPGLAVLVREEQDEHRGRPRGAVGAAPGRAAAAASPSRRRPGSAPRDRRAGRRGAARAGGRNAPSKRTGPA